MKQWLCRLLDCNTETFPPLSWEDRIHQLLLRQEQELAELHNQHFLEWYRLMQESEQSLLKDNPIRKRIHDIWYEKGRKL